MSANLSAHSAGREGRMAPEGGKIKHPQNKAKQTELFSFPFGCSHLGLNVFRNNESHTKNIPPLLLTPQHVKGQATWRALICILVGTVCG